MSAIGHVVDRRARAGWASRSGYALVQAGRRGGAHGLRAQARAPGAPPLHPGAGQLRASGSSRPSPETEAVFLAVPDAGRSRRWPTPLAGQGPAPEGCAAFHLSGALSTDVLAPLHARGYAVGSLPSPPGRRPPGHGRGADARVLRRRDRRPRGDGGGPAAGGGAGVADPHRARDAAARSTTRRRSWRRTSCPPLLDAALRMLERAGVSPGRGACRRSFPWCGARWPTSRSVGWSAAVTGPVARGDVETVELHLRALDPDDIDGSTRFWDASWSGIAGPRWTKTAPTRLLEHLRERESEHEHAPLREHRPRGHGPAGAPHRRARPGARGGARRAGGARTGSPCTCARTGGTSRTGTSRLLMETVAHRREPGAGRRLRDPRPGVPWLARCRPPSCRRSARRSPPRAGSTCRRAAKRHADRERASSRLVGRGHPHLALHRSRRGRHPGRGRPGRRRRGAAHRASTPTPGARSGGASSAALNAAASPGAQAGLAVHAGHGLTYENVTPVAAIPEIEELNIGHSIVSRAVFTGLEAAVREMADAHPPRAGAPVRKTLGQGPRRARRHASCSLVGRSAARTSARSGPRSGEGDLLAPRGRRGGGDVRLLHPGAALEDPPGAGEARHQAPRPASRR